MSSEEHVACGEQHVWQQTHNEADGAGSLHHISSNPGDSNCLIAANQAVPIIRARQAFFIWWNFVVNTHENCVLATSSREYLMVGLFVVVATSVSIYALASTGRALVTIERIASTLV